MTELEESLRTQLLQAELRAANLSERLERLGRAVFDYAQALQAADMTPARAEAALIQLMLVYASASTGKHPYDVQREAFKF